MKATKKPAIAHTEMHESHQVIHPRNMLKARSAVHVDTDELIDEDAIEKAEAAVIELQPQFFGWMDRYVADLIKARDALWSRGISESTVDGLYRAAHEVRGTGTTFGFPLASRIAESLTYLIEKIGLNETPKLLIDQHVDAVRAIVHEGARGEGRNEDTGVQLVQRLAVVTNRYIEMREAALAKT
jgi:chemotaxis protein histidine kinase CheA